MLTDCEPTFWVGEPPFNTHWTEVKSDFFASENPMFVRSLDSVPQKSKCVPVRWTVVLALLRLKQNVSEVPLPYLQVAVQFCRGTLLTQPQCSELPVWQLPRVLLAEVSIKENSRHTLSTREQSHLYRWRFWTERRDLMSISPLTLPTNDSTQGITDPSKSQCKEDWQLGNSQNLLTQGIQFYWGERSFQGLSCPQSAHC